MENFEKIFKNCCEEINKRNKFKTVITMLLNCLHKAFKNEN